MTSTVSATTQDLPATLASMSAASLYVGDLLPHINEVILYKKFAPMGTVTSVKLCRDWVTGQSLCYAYVNFENPAEAEKAYRTLNYELLEGQPMRIMKSTRNPWLPKAGDCACYHHHHCCGVSNNNNRDLCLDAKTLMEAIENYSMAFKNLAIHDAVESREPTGYKYSSEFLRRMNTLNDRFTNVFIKNFKDLLDDCKLYKLCKQFGEVTSARVMLDEYGLSKGFGFACFTDPDAAHRAVNKLNGLVLDGRTLYAGPAMSRTQRQRDGSYGRYNEDHRNDWRILNRSGTTFANSNTVCSPRICIRNLRDVVDDIRLRKEFERFGPVAQAELLKTYDGRSKGIGYVIYKDQADAAKALNSMHGKVIYGTRISVTYAPYSSPFRNQYDSTQFFNRNDSTNRELQHHASDSHPNACSSSSSTSPDHTTRGVSKGGANSNGTSNDDDKNYSQNKSIQQFKDLVTSLANKGHPVNINDINNFSNSGGSIVNRNSSNNIDNVNTSNNAILAMSGRKPGDKQPQQQQDQKQKQKGQNGKNDAEDPSNSKSIAHSKRENHSKAGINGRRDESCEDGSLERDLDGMDELSTTATLSVRNLDDSITDERLESLFKVYGQVMSAKVISSEHGVSKGFGFVVMSDVTDAVRAIKNLDGRIVVNRPVYVALTTGQTRPLTT